MSRDCVIYKITNIITSQIYIGSSIDIKSRLSRHFRDLKNSKHHSIKMQRSYDKYGSDSFKVEHLIIIPERYRQKMEQWFLDNNECYFNNEKIVNKPSLTRVFTEEEREKSRLRMIGNDIWKLKPPMTEEHKKKSAFLSKNRIWTDQSRNKLSESMKGNPSRTNLPHSDATKKKMSNNSVNKRSVCQYSLDGLFIEKWESISLVLKTFNYANSSIVKCCQEKQKTAYGYIWKYAENVDVAESIESQVKKYNYLDIYKYYTECDSHSETMNKFNIPSSTLYYIINKNKNK